MRCSLWSSLHNPWHVPPSSVLVPAIQHVYNMFGNALDAKTGQPFFQTGMGQSKFFIGACSSGLPFWYWWCSSLWISWCWSAWSLVVEIFLPYNHGWRGTTYWYISQVWCSSWWVLQEKKVQAADFIMLARPCLTVNCLTDQCTWYNLQGFFFVIWSWESFNFEFSARHLPNICMV